MFYEVGHPNTSPADWETFGKEFSPYLFEEVISRKGAKLSDSFVPLARGVGVAAPYLLARTGYQQGMYRPRGWKKTDVDVFDRDIGSQNEITVRGISRQPLWGIERFSNNRKYRNFGEVLVFLFGSTPIVTRNYQSAICLSEFCHRNGPPAGFRWINAAPYDAEGAIRFAKQRRKYEQHSKH